MLNKLVFATRHCRCDSRTLTSSKLLFASWENSFVSLELVKPCLNSDLCMFVHRALLASGRNKCTWNYWVSAKTQLKSKNACLNAPYVFSKFIHPSHQTPLEFLACDRLDTEFCGACLWEASISGSRLQLVDLFSQEMGKKERKMKNKW